MVRVEKYQCLKCKDAFSTEDYKLNHLCPKCGITLLPQLPTTLPPKYWLFQFNPGIYNWFGWIRENRDTEQWLVTRHSKFICEGDMVAIWSSGKSAGIYALGWIISYPRKTPLNEVQLKYYLEKDDSLKFLKKPSVVVKYSNLIAENPIAQDQCKKDAILSAMEVLTNPEGTNFRLRRQQWERILEKTATPSTPIN
jgi:hypothetical protein